MSTFAHGDNISTKVNKNPQCPLLKQLLEHYQIWKTSSLAITGISRLDTDRIVDQFERYKNFIDQQEYKNHFSPQSKLHSSVLEEFMYYLCRRIPNLEPSMALGAMEAYTNLFFAPMNLKDLNQNCGMVVYTKNQDFAIAKSATIVSIPYEAGNAEDRQLIRIPVLSAECKSYVDKTMYEGSIATAERIKQGNPYSRFIIVAEFWDVASSIDPKFSKIDQIYILRNQTRRQAKKNLNKINRDVVSQMFDEIKKHLEIDWSNMRRKLTNGIMI